MALENQFLSALKQLLETEPELFKDSERTKLEGLITSLPSDTKQLVDGIARWCASHSDIDNSLKSLIKDKPPFRGAGSAFPTPEAKAEYEKNSKEELLNAIRKSSPPETKKPNTPKG
ncbi:hypothetical protein [Moorena bouillonii]|uniref:Uncharacterized protein n=1 Tax=Moorena bouillonii PNG TaxID=568701 RepID=A0A1U7N3G9_9CYAN|nr:hypothetical protein [Moorena bouillonii]OLT60502.1 hypothetical protein BJP37_17275 [Moorena bouillonii PNG]